eukprot:TRINITY_DN48806_c0_g1_i1.p1 TRINITY_DN48806_c0_g1~~TRINITY_DN48806_c0_g1_i1.p1  ORF type:complete len:351 (+),score=31.82 TRINITY_DN48806_c0_g1_i1:45-1097(+)
MGDRFAQLQAILAGLPMYAVPAPSRSCGPDLLVQCSGQRMHVEHRMQASTCAQRVQYKLSEIASEYPDHESTLRVLQVEHASLDLVCFADHGGHKLFVAVRGTDPALNPLTVRGDMHSNMNILLGYSPKRADTALEEYRNVRRRFPTYATYGSGHSLGGAVVCHVAKSVELQEELSFERVDVFNTATSPLTRSLAILEGSVLHAHRVPGDWASWGLCIFEPGTGIVHTHEIKPHVRNRHALGHFLPPRVGEIPDAFAVNGTTVLEAQPQWSARLLHALHLFSCVGPRKKDHAKHVPRRNDPLTASASGEDSPAQIADVGPDRDIEDIEGSSEMAMNYFTAAGHTCNQRRT